MTATPRGAKWADTPVGAIASSVADMDLPTPPFILDAIRTELSRGAGYSSPAELREPLEAAADWWGTHHGWAFDVDRSLPIDSMAATAAWVLVRTTAPGDRVVRLRPTYPPLVDAVRSLDRVDVPVDVVRSGSGWELDLDALDAACATAQLLVWVAPHNPTGRVWRRDEVVAVAEIAARHGLTVIADEVWADVLLGDHRHVPFAEVAAEVDAQLAERTVTLLGTSKAWNLAGLGSGVLHAGGSALFTALRGTGHVPMVSTPHRPSLVAATTAWRRGAAWLAATLALVERNVEVAGGALVAALGADRVTLPQGTYLAWIDLRGLVPDDDPMAVLAVRDGVVPTDGAGFGAPGWIRCNLATTEGQADELARRVTAAVTRAG